MSSSKPEVTLEFQLAYLAVLTSEGLKPLSRWERRLRAGERRVIERHGLTVLDVRRRTQIGIRRTESVMSTDPDLAEAYRARFAGRRLQETPEAVRAQGRFFGYPDCCIEAFIRHPYAANGLRREDQSILFHWACPDCIATARLLPAYRRIHDRCLELDLELGVARRRLGVSGGKAQAASSSTAQAAVSMARDAARAAVAVAFIAGAAGLARAEDPHWLPIGDDADHDYLAVPEEIVIGTDWSLNDSDGNLVLDGVQVAQWIRALIENPPPNVLVTDHPVYGIESCSVCGEQVNMGFVEIHHSLRDLTLTLPYIALHYLEHGGLSYQGSVHSGRADLQALKEILFPCEFGHLVPPVGMDPDEDGLLSEEEPLLETDPDDPDTDNDSLEDGPQTAERLRALLSQIPREPRPDQPYLLEHWMDGVEQCEICGAWANMGAAEIVNPAEGLSLMAPFVSLHCLGQGSFVYDGTQNQGRLLPVVLQTQLLGDGTVHWLPVEGDTDGDGLTDEEEDYFGFDHEDPDENLDGVPDGRFVATYLAGRIAELPEGPLPDEAYLTHHPAYGFYNCVTCGTLINMGFLTITDPIAGTSVDVSYYNQHFLEHGSFSTDRGDIYPRQDPCALAEILDYASGTESPAAAEPGIRLWNAPNPVPPATGTTIVLALPREAGPIEVAIFDATGRQVRELYTGPSRTGALHLGWDGRGMGGEALPGGVYLCRVQCGSLTLTRKLLLAE